MIRPNHPQPGTKRIYSFRMVQKVFQNQRYGNYSQAWQQKPDYSFYKKFEITRRWLTVLEIRQRQNKTAQHKKNFNCL